MKPLRSRHDLLALIVQHAPTNACLRAATEGRATLYGAFTVPGQLPCYIVRVIAKYNQSWTIRIEVDEKWRRYPVQVIDELEVPWVHWAGSRSGKRELVDGDHSEVWAFKRMAAQSRQYPRIAQ